MKLSLAYNPLKKTQHTLYLFYLTEDITNFGADNKVYFKVDNWAIELNGAYQNGELQTEKLDSEILFNILWVMAKITILDTKLHLE